MDKCENLSGLFEKFYAVKNFLNENKNFICETDLITKIMPESDVKDNPTFFNKLFLKEFLLNNKDILEEKYLPVMYWKLILNAKKISILRDSQYKHVMQKHPIFYTDCLKRVFCMFEDLDKYICKKSTDIRDLYNIYKQRSLYNLICINLGSIARDDEIAEVLLNYLAKVGANVSKENQKRFDFYVYNKEMMDKINKTSSTKKIGEIILDNTASLVMDTIKIISDSYYLSEL